MPRNIIIMQNRPFSVIIGKRAAAVCLRKPLAERVDKELKLWTNKKACIIIKATDNRKKL